MPITSYVNDNLFCFKGSLTLLTKDIEDEIESSPCKSSMSTKDPIGKNLLLFMFHKKCMSVLVCDEGPGICALILTIFSLFLIAVSLPVSLLWVVKVVQVTMYS